MFRTLSWKRMFLKLLWEKRPPRPHCTLLCWMDYRCWRLQKRIFIWVMCATRNTLSWGLICTCHSRSLHRQREKKEREIYFLALPWQYIIVSWERIAGILTCLTLIAAFAAVPGGTENPCCLTSGTSRWSWTITCNKAELSAKVKKFWFSWDYPNRKHLRWCFSQPERSQWVKLPSFFLLIWSLS